MCHQNNMLLARINVSQDTFTILYDKMKFKYQEPYSLINFSYF